MAIYRIATLLLVVVAGLGGASISAAPGASPAPLLPIEVKEATFDGSESVTTTLTDRFDTTYTFTGQSTWHIVWDAEHANGELHPESSFTYSGTASSSRDGQLCSASDVEWHPVSLFLDATYVRKGHYRFTVTRPSFFAPYHGAGCGSPDGQFHENPAKDPLPGVLPAKPVDVSSGFASVSEHAAASGSEKTDGGSTITWDHTLEGVVTFGRPTCAAAPGRAHMSPGSDDGCAVAVVKLTAEDDIAIREVKDKPLWRRKFDASCVLKDVDSSEDPPPIADSAKSRFFEINATLDACPKKPAGQPSISWTATAGGERSTGKFRGWSGTLKVKTPGAVGAYDLVLQFTITVGKRKLPQTTSHLLYVTHDEPMPDVSPPKLRWLEVATKWAKGATAPGQVAGLTNSNEYREGRRTFGWEYGYSDRSNACELDWEKLIDEQGGDRTECSIFATVWVKLVRVNGLDAGTQAYGSKIAVMLKDDRIALDNAGMNARKFGTQKFDRWVFGSHTVGRFQGAFYDPTFGIKYGSLRDNVYATALTKTTTDADGQWQWYRLEDGSGCIKARWPGKYNARGWKMYEYKPQVWALC